jgi:hypothetical protein
LAWHFCTEKNSKKIEKVQERALRFVYEDYNSSYDKLLKKAKVPSLHIDAGRGSGGNASLGCHRHLHSA